MRRLALLTALLVGCGGGEGDSGPSLEITSPARGLIADSTTVTVEGRADPAAQLVVNGEAVALAADGSFSVALELSTGTQLIETVATLDGTETKDIRSVSLGERAGAAELAAGTIFHVGTVGLGQTANARLQPARDNDAVISEIMAGNPIADVGGTGCAQNDVISVATLGPPILNVFAYTKLGGVAGELLFSPIDATLSVDYPTAAPGCTDSSGTFDFDTLELHYAFSLDFSGSAGDFTVTTSEDLRLYDHPLMTDPGDIDPGVSARVTANIEAHMADALIAAGTTEFIRLFEGWLEGYGRTEMAEVGGSAVQIDVVPDQALESEDGLTVVQSLSFGGVADGAWVPTPTDPVLPVTRRGAISMSDDAIDEVLGGVWASDGLSATTSSGATLEMLVPPSVNADGNLTVGDWIVHDGDTEVALLGSAELIAAFTETDISVGPGEISLEAQVIAGDMSTGDLQALIDEASAILGERVGESLAALSIELVEESAPMLAPEYQGGYIVMDTFLPPP